MSNHAKIIIPIFLLLIIYAVYTLTKTEDIGSFENIRASGEINRAVNVFVVGSRGFERDANNNIISFFVRDKQDAEAKVNLQEPTPEDIANAEIVELFGHMHGNTFIALRVDIVKLLTD
jgi:hypothetical protein